MSNKPDVRRPAGPIPSATARPASPPETNPSTRTGLSKPVTAAPRDGVLEGLREWLEGATTKLTTVAAKEGRTPDTRVMGILKKLAAGLTSGAGWAVQGLIRLRDWTLRKWGELDMWERIKGGFLALVAGLENAAKAFFHPNELDVEAIVK